VDGEMPREAPVTFPTPDRHVGDRHHPAEKAASEQALIVSEGAARLGLVRVRHDPKGRAMAPQRIWTDRQKAVTSDGV
jgi:hypothetical protein